MYCLKLLLLTSFLVTSVPRATKGFLLDSYQHKQYSCNFEVSTCQYGSSPVIHGLAWLRHQIGPMTSLPTKDHTYNTTGKGHVMYIPPSSLAWPGDKITLQSSVLDGLKGTIAVGFWYIISGGASSIRLNVTVTDSSTGMSQTTIRTGQRVNYWTHGCLIANSASGNVSVTFEADYIYTSGYPAIALDDVTVESGSSCSRNIVTSSTASPPSAGTVSCDFETASLCGYTNVAHKSGSFDWSRHKGPTASASTGPAADHTTGRGYYMYIETSSPRVRGDFARLESPPFVADGHQRLRFWYNTYGSSIGALKVYLEHLTESGSILGSPVYQDSRAMINDTVWKKGCFEIPKIIGLTKVVFEGIVGNDFHGDIAIDDVILDTGSCNALPSEHWLTWGAWSSCSHTCGNATRERLRACSSFGCPGSNVQRMECNYVFCEVSCDFESSSICGYHSLKDDFSWIWHKGGTQSTATGPYGDHTTGNGYYMYVESSSPRVLGDTASLQSPAFSPEGVQRLTFWYSAYGSSVGTLKVTLTDKTFLGLISHSTELFAISTGSKSRDWLYACVDLPSSNSNSHIVFTGEVGNGYNGDLGIDDVKLERGNCSTLSTTPLPSTLATSTSTSPSKSTLVSTMTSALTSSMSPTSTTSSTRTTQATQTKTTLKTTSISLQTTNVMGYWSHWYSDPCTVSCGNGTRTRVRHCSTGSDVHCGGPGMETVPCNEGPCPVDGNWAEWSSFSACSVTCGSGHMTSSRLCNNPSPQNNGLSCQGNSTRQSACQQNPCTVNGKWSEWQTWTPCSVSCNSGTRSRDRSCDNPAPQNGGKSCTGDMTEVETCNSVTCPEWSEWFYGNCHVTCGSGNTTRIRHCSTGNDVDCGNESSVETVACNGGPCPVDGGWGTWQTWGVCSQTCGNGTRDRHRKCDNPAPQNGGQECSAFGKDSGACYLVECPYWLPFEQVSACSVTCGRGFASLKRNCSTGIPSDCPGSPYDEHACILNDCVK